MTSSNGVGRLKEGTVRTAVGRRENGEEKDYLDFYYLGFFPQFNFWTFLKNSLAIKALVSVNSGPSACLGCHRERLHFVCISPTGHPVA